MKIFAIIPIKHESTRVPMKNFRMMNGRPLYFYIINTLLQVKKVDKIIIDSNSPIIFENIPKLFKENMNKIVLYERPVHLWPGNTATNDLLINVIEDLGLDADLYLQTHTTNPLLKKETIERAIDEFDFEKYDSLFSAKVLHTRLYDKNFRDMNHNRFKLIPTQDLDPIYEENSCIYLFSKETLSKFGSRIGENPYIYKMSEIESQDIDWEDDFVITEMIQRYLEDKEKVKILNK